MSNGSERRDGSSDPPAMDHAGDQVLVLGNDAAAAYLDVYQQTAARIGRLQDELGMACGSSAGDGTPGRQRALEVSEMLQETSKKATLSFLNAVELATLAISDRDE